MKKKEIILFVSIFIFLSLIAGGTYAYWGWRSGVNKSVVFNTSKGIEDYIIYDEGESHFVGDFQPSTNYCNNTIYNTISIKKKSADIEIPLVATINMDVNHIANSIKNSDNVYWVLIAGDSTSCTGNLDGALAYGKFKNVSSGSTISLLNNQWVGGDFVTDNTSFHMVYTIYIWIDSAGNNSSLSGDTIDVNIWTQVDQVAGWYGDVTLNGVVTATDYSRLLAHVKKTNLLSSKQALINADVNGDGIIDTVDTELVLNRVEKVACLTLPYSQCISG